MSRSVASDRVRLRDEQRDAACDALASVDAASSTLCEGWTAHDLAAHLWVLDHPSPSWAGLVVTSIDPLAATKKRWPYAELVGRLRNGPSTFACMPLDPRAGNLHAIGEWFVHTEDVRRAHDLPRRQYTAELQDALWARVQRAARQLNWRRPTGLVLRRVNGGTSMVVDKPAGVVVTGEPAELMMWAYGRTSVADVVVEPQP